MSDNLLEVVNEPSDQNPADSLRLRSPNEAGMERLGQLFAQTMVTDLTVYLNGNLGMGKTTLSRGIIRGYGHTGSVKSPTYTLVEPYQVGSQRIFHFDLYRLADPEELEYLGIRDYFAEPAVRLIEWPEKGEGLLAEADLIVSLSVFGQGREIELQAKSVSGTAMLESLKLLLCGRSS